MKKKQLEMLLQKTPDFPNPQSSLEQYQTPAPIATDILFYAYQNHDINQKRILDLGCGTGIFSIGAKVLGAKSVTGIDIDKEAITLANDFAKTANLEIEFQVQDIMSYSVFVDTVVMNPPFGAQKDNIHADQLFLKKAVDNANIIYSLHLLKTLPHLEKYIEKLDAKIDEVYEISFPLKSQFSFHKKLVDQVQVCCLRIIH